MATHPATGTRDPVEVREGELLWTPSRQRVARANLTAFTGWLAQHRGLNFADYTALWGWSVADLAGFWGALWDYADITASAEPTQVLADRDMPGAQWFPGARLNYAGHVLAQARPGQTALIHASEQQSPTAMAWDDLAGQVRALATHLRELGVGPGDRVVAFVPNIPEAVVALLATASIGAVWACCSPDFGAAGALDRFAQLTPSVLIAADGYVHGGTAFDRRDAVATLAEGLPGLAHVIHVAHLDPAGTAPVAGAHRWDELMRRDVAAGDVAIEAVAFDHPLWVLFSSGTTGPPKALVHSHGGILLEQLKLQHLHMDLGPGERLLFHTTTGWMMWNFLVSALAHGVVPVCYDGHPLHPRPDVLWQLAADTRAALFGASPAFVDRMADAGVVPGRQFDLSALREIMPAGAPVAPAHTAWFYANVDPDVWVATGSGGTDMCTGFVGGVPTLPVYAGEIQARSLGVAAHALNDRGERVVDEVGELVITEPMPSMPVSLWGDDADHHRYRATYFDRAPGVWRHGDFFRVNARGGCFVLGRSDATLNRHGVRIGTAEIYRVVEPMAEIREALAVEAAAGDGASRMTLFVVPADDVELDEQLATRIRQRLRTRASPRHVPDEIVAVPDIPKTLTGKKLEVPVRRILSGTPPDEAANPAAMANPQSLAAVVAHAGQPTTS